MSTSYWLISGVGIACYNIEPYVKKDKLFDFIRRELCKEDLERLFPGIEYPSLSIEEIVSMSGYDNLADLLCHCDDTDSLTYGDDGEGNCYFYYPPSMPWEHTPTEPKSVEEVIDRIVNSIQQITDMTSEQIESYIDTELHVVGIG